MRKLKVNKLIFIDPVLPEFNKATVEQLSYVFEQYDPKNKHVITVIPKNYCDGVGKGYAWDVMNLLGAKELYTIPMYRYGVPIQEDIVIIASFDFLKLKKGATKYLPKNNSFLRHHCALPMSRVKSHIDLVSQGFILSAGKMFPAREDWKERTPIVQDKKESHARLMTEKECITFFGESNPKAHIPKLMVETIAKKIK